MLAKVPSLSFKGDTLMNSFQKNPIIILFINVIAIILAYYVSILLHEWGHGTLAWLNGVKNSPFDVQYGGWLLMNVDEHVNYASLLSSGRGIAAALIGIAGCIVSFIIVVSCFILINRKNLRHNPVKFVFIYWFLIMNMVPTVQYFFVSTFSSEGDVGRFTHGLNISAWWVFVPGTIFVFFVLWRILRFEIIKAYALIPIKSILGKNMFLLTTLSIIFLFIYTHGYNPLSDQGMNTLGKALVLISIVLVPILFVFFNPSRNWVKKAVSAYNVK